MKQRELGILKSKTMANVLNISKVTKYIEVSRSTMDMHTNIYTFVKRAIYLSNSMIQDTLQFVFSPNTSVFDLFLDVAHITSQK